MMKRIIYALSILCALVSCVQEKFDEDMAGEPGVIKVRIEKPELEVKSSGTTYYAYVWDAAAGAISEPISPLKESGTCIYYNIPKEAEQVLFTNVYDDSSSYYWDVDISSPEDGNVKFSNDVSSGELNKELLASYVKGVKAGSSEIYEVSMKRLSAKVTTEFELVDADGTVIANSGIDDITVTYSAAGGEVLLDSEGAVSPLSDKKFTCYLSRSSTTLFSVSEHCLPGVSKTSISVSVDPSSGSAIVYTKPLDLVLEANHHYTVKVKVRQHNANASFELADISVTTSSYSTTMSKVDFFDVSDGLYVGSAAGDEASVTVGTALPYEWTCALTEGSDWFELSRDGNVLKVVSKVANESEVRTGKITLTCDEGYEKVITVGQKLTTKDKIVLTYKGTTSDIYIYISGENISVKDPNDAVARLFSGRSVNRQIYIDGLTNGGEVVIEGDVITGFMGFANVDGWYDRGYYNQYNYGYDSYIYEFENCKYLECLSIQPYNATALDFSGMTSLKRLHLEHALFTSITFAEGQKLEEFSAYNCDTFNQLALINVSSTLRKLRCYDCDGLLGANLTNFKSLKSVDVSGCNKMANINLTGCTGLETFSLSDNSASVLNITDCSSLKELYWTTSLDKIIHDGADALELISGGYVAELTLSGKNNLKTIKGLGASSFTLSDCPNLTSMGQIYSVYDININNCPLLDAIDVDFADSSYETYTFTDCANITKATFYDMGAECDFSQLPGLKTLALENLYGKTIKTIDLSGNKVLETLRVDSDYSDLTLNNIIFPNSIKEVDLYYLYDLISIDLSDRTLLESLKAENCYYLYDINMKGCSSLKSLTLYNVSQYRLYQSGTNDYRYGTLNLSGCSSLQYINRYAENYSDDMRYIKYVDFTGCSSLEYVNLYDAEIETLDFSDSPKLTYMDLRRNCLSKDAIDSMIKTLPDWSADPTVIAAYMMSGNSGYSTYDKSAAEAKGWYLGE